MEKLFQSMIITSRIKMELSYIPTSIGRNWLNGDDSKQTYCGHMKLILNNSSIFFNKFFCYKKEYVSIHLREHDDNLIDDYFMFKLFFYGGKRKKRSLIEGNILDENCKKLIYYGLKLVCSFILRELVKIVTCSVVCLS